MEHKFLTIKVDCPRDNCRIQTMQIHLIDHDGNGFFPLKAPGCDYCNASDICEKCRIFITKHFIDDTDYRSTDVIAPNFPKSR